MNDTSGQTPPANERRGRSSKAVAADQARAVRRYLSAIESTRPGRGTKRTTDAIGNRITKVDEMLISADPLTRVHLTQERIELHAEQVRLGNGNQPPLAQLERDFVRVIRSYSDRNGISFAAWRQVGVDTKVLDRAGIHKAEKKPPPAAVRAAAEAAADEPRDAPVESAVGSTAAVDQPVEDTGTPQPPAAASPEVDEREPTRAAAAKPRPVDEPPENGTSSDAVVGGPDSPTPEVSLEELASLLTSVGSGAAPAAADEASQPALGDEVAPPVDRASPSSRSPQPAAEE
ncbi:MAG: hypothetical protein ACR2G7_11610 [Acidimicrobiales bacterium]